MKNSNKNGITLIALVITIIVLLILVGVTLKLVGDDGIIAKAKWSAYVTEYEAVEEQKEMYATTYYMDKFSKKKNVMDVYKMASLSSIAKTTDEKIAMYPVSEKLEIGSMYNSLKETIKYMENLQDNDLGNEDLVNLYKVDFEKISANAKKTYAINIVSGMLYSIEYEEYQGKYYHTPQIGFVVDGNGGNGGIKDEGEKELNISEPGQYNVIINANEVVKWDSIEVVYKKFVEGTVEVSSFTSNELTEWSNVGINEAELTGKSEKYVINSAENSQYIKISINLAENEKGKNSEISYVKVNYYKLEETDIKPEVTSRGAEETEGIYTVPTPASNSGPIIASGTASVTQTVTLPEGNDEYILDLNEIGDAVTTVTIQKTDGIIETITGNEVANVVIPGDSTVTITTTLNAGDGVKRAKICKKYSELISMTSSTIASIGNPDGEDEFNEWTTVEQKNYIYNNGGNGYWEKCLVQEDVFGIDGIIEKDDEKRICVQFLTSDDCASWSESFTNLENAENKKYLKILVNYQTKNNAEYSNINDDRITVIINDGYWTATFKDTDGSILLNKKVYFADSGKTGNLELPRMESKSSVGKTAVGWKDTSSSYEVGATQTITADIGYTGVFLKLNIETVEDLCALRDVVDDDLLSLKGFTVNLMNDLDLSSVCSATLGSWEPIGRHGAGYFNGKFEGNNHAINNVYIKSSESWAKGLFGFLDSEGVVKNLTVSGEITCNYSSGFAAGGIVGRNNGKIENCTNHASVTKLAVLGGICGNNTGIIKECVNYGSINGKQAGGIVGNNASNSQIDKCRNEGTITGTENIAGICGYQTAGNISSCSNSGIVTGTNYIAGICGYKEAGNISSCSNSGTVTGTNYIAGICAYQVAGDITNCLNSGNVDGIYTFGGIVSYNKSTVSLCANTGGITCYKTGSSTGLLIGGIAGVNEGTVEKCFNKGNVNNAKKSGATGGIVGRNFNTVKYCANSGIVNALGLIGGIVGNNQAYVEYVYNTAQVEQLSKEKEVLFGGIVGNLNKNDSAYIKNSYNIGNAKTEISTHSSGGIVGRIACAGTVAYCYNAGEISGGTEGSIYGEKKNADAVADANNGTATQNEMKNWTQQDINSKIGSGFVKKTGGLPILNIKIPIYNNFVF